MKSYITATSIFCLILSSPALALDIPLTVKEPAGITRDNEPITSGIPLPEGTQTANWSLWKNNQQIPVQLTTLPGRAPWLLLDFQDSVEAFGNSNLILRDIASTVAHPTPLQFTEDQNQVEVATGPLKVQINKQIYNLFETIWLDKDGNGQFSNSEKVAISTTDNILAIDATTNSTYSGKRTAN